MRLRTLYARPGRSAMLMLVGTSLLVLSCTADEINAFFASRSGQFAVGFSNKTPYRAVFTVGAYDDLNQFSIPEFQQFRIEGNQTAGPIFLNCRRVVSVGGATLLALIDQAEAAIPDRDAFVETVNFSSAPANSALAAAPTEGTAEPQIRRLGDDFPCGGYCIFTFEADPSAPGGFRIDYALIR